MFKNISLILIIIMLINTNSFAENKIDYNCIETEKAAKDKVKAQIKQRKLELIKMVNTLMQN